MISVLPKPGLTPRHFEIGFAVSGLDTGLWVRLAEVGLMRRPFEFGFAEVRVSAACSARFCRNWICFVILSAVLQRSGLRRHFGFGFADVGDGAKV